MSPCGCPSQLVLGAPHMVSPGCDADAIRGGLLQLLVTSDVALDRSLHMVRCCDRILLS